MKFIVFVLIFGVGNLLLVGGQKLTHWKDQTRLDDIHRQLDTDKGDIDNLEAQLGDADGMLSRLEADLNEQEARIRDVNQRVEALGSEIDDIEGRSPSGVPSSIYGQYSQMVDEHNRLVDQQRDMVRRYNVAAQQYNDGLSRFQATSKAYDDKISRYNAMVTEGNGLAKTIGSTWVIVPVPRVGSHPHVTAPPRR